MSRRQHAPLSKVAVLISGERGISARRNPLTFQNSFPVTWPPSIVTQKEHRYLSVSIFVPRSPHTQQEESGLLWLDQVDLLFVLIFIDNPLGFSYNPCVLGKVRLSIAPQYLI